MLGQSLSTGQNLLIIIINWTKHKSMRTECNSILKFICDFNSMQMVDLFAEHLHIQSFENIKCAKTKQVDLQQ